jgi:hypothetical protein
MNRSTSFEIFKRNQVLFIEVGIIYVVLLCFMLFLPLGGATYAISSVILFWIFTSLIILMLNKEVRKEFDFEDLFKDNRLPKKIKLFLLTISAFVITLIEVKILDNFNLENWVFNILMTIITISETLLITLFLFNRINLFLTAMLYSFLSIIVTFLTLILGGIFFTPFIFIVLFNKKVFNEEI